MLIIITDKDVLGIIQKTKGLTNSHYSDYDKAYSKAMKHSGDHKAGAMATLYVSALWDILREPTNTHKKPIKTHKHRYNL